MQRLALLALVGLSSVSGQWLNQPAAGIPRAANGQPDLKAPTPRADGKPDLSGVWSKSAGQYSTDIAADRTTEMLPWVRSLYQRRIDDYAKDNMLVQCVPEGPRYATKSAFVKIVQTPQLIVILNEDLTYRQVFLDGRSFPDDPNPAWMGYSIGHWDGDTLVVETAGFNDRTWLDGTGHAHTENLRLTERYRRADFGHLSVEVTLADPGAYTKPWTIKVSATLQPDTDLLEYVCAESKSGREHYVGQVEKDLERAPVVEPEVLASYVGRYEMSIDGAKLTVDVTLAAGKLYINRGGRGPQPMVAITKTSFSSPVGTWDFRKDANGVYIVYMQVESEVRGVRK